MWCVPILLNLIGLASVAVATPTAEPPDEIVHLECPAEIAIPADVFASKPYATDLTASFRFCGVNDLVIERLEFRDNPAAIDVRFEISAGPGRGYEIDLQVVVISREGITVAEQRRTQKISGGRTTRRSLRLSRSTRWIREFGDRSLVIVHAVRRR